MDIEKILASQEKKIGNTGESTYAVMRIHPKQLRKIWGQCFPLLVKGMGANPVMAMQEVIVGLADQSVQFWIVARGSEIEAVFLTSMERDRGEWVLSLYSLGGTGARKWVGDVHRAMHRFARLEDCRRVRMCGRPAWQRILPDYPVVGERGGHLIYERPVGDI